MAHSRQVALMIVSTLCVGHKARAQSYGATRLGADETRALETATKDIEFVEFENQYYINSKQPSFHPGATTDDNSVAVGIHATSKLWSHTTGKLDFQDRYSAGEDYNYLDIFDASAQWHEGRETVIVGRSLMHWSDTDERWKQGLFQPRYLEDRLNPKEAGLTGIFYTQSTAVGAFTLAALPLYIPDFGPGYQVENNHLVSRNPWFSAPTQQFVYQGQASEIHYSMGSPDTVGLISHAGAAAKWDWRYENYSSRISAAYKPVQTLALGFPSDHQVILAEHNDYADVTITPRVIYDRVASWDGEVKVDAWRMTASVAFDDPVITPAPDDWTAQEMGPATICSALIERDFFTKSQSPFTLGLDTLKVNGGSAGDSGRFAGSGSMFEPRFQYFEAYALSIKQKIYGVFNFPLENRLRILYDRMQGGGVVSLSSSLNFTRNWRAALDMDLIGLLESSAPIQDGFLATYRANSRVGLGVSYVF